MAHGKQLLVVQHFHRRIVVHAFGELLYFSLQVGAVNHAGGVPYAREIKGFAIGRPAIIVHTRLEGFGDVGLLAVAQIHYAQAVAVAFVSVALHALPGDASAVGREFRVGVVAHVLVLGIFLTQVSGLLGCYIIKVDVRVGRLRIRHARLLAAGISNLFRVVAPC